MNVFWTPVLTWPKLFCDMMLLDNLRNSVNKYGIEIESVHPVTFSNAVTKSLNTPLS